MHGLFANPLPNYNLQRVVDNRPPQKLNSPTGRTQPGV